MTRKTKFTNEKKKKHKAHGFKWRNWDLGIGKDIENDDNVIKDRVEDNDDNDVDVGEDNDGNGDNYDDDDSDDNDVDVG